MTLTPAIPRDGLRREQGAPLLIQALDCAFPLHPPVCHWLDHVSEVVLGRGDGPARDASTLRIGVPDRSMSAVHARLMRDGETWRVLDCSSTNGTFLGGEPIALRELADGDVLEMGHAQFVFRRDAPRGRFAAAPDPALETVSPALAASFARLPAIARAPLPVVIGGESGTGKELLARALHRLSRRTGPFVAVNCGAIAPTLLESELFGHRRGAFSGATESRPGLVRAADRGTLFLDEIAELSAAAQAAVLRVLEEGEVLPVGSTEVQRVDVRVLAATNVDLEDAVAAQRFRADLHARIAGYTIRLPPLRHRREDLGLLVAAALRRAGAASASFTPEAGRALMRYRWPLNVRELDRCVRVALALSGGERIGIEHLPESLVRCDRSIAAIPRLRPRALSPEDVRRREQIAALLRENRGNVAAVARAVGKARMQVHRWVKRFDLSLADYR